MDGMSIFIKCNSCGNQIEIKTDGYRSCVWADQYEGFTNDEFSYNISQPDDGEEVNSDHIKVSSEIVRCKCGNYIRINY